MRLFLPGPQTNLSDLNSQNESFSKQENAALTIQKCFRGWKVRKSTVLPKDLTTFINDHFPTVGTSKDPKNTNVRIFLSREINEMIADPKRFARVRLSVYSN